MALTLVLWAAAAQAQEFRYRYVPFDQVSLPPGFNSFRPAGINNGDRVGWVVKDNQGLPHVALFANGDVTVLQPGVPGNARVINERGAIGGSVLTDPVHFIEQAALYRGDQVELIPRQPGEVTSFVIGLNDSDTALVLSFDALARPTVVLFKNGQTTPLDFGLTLADPLLFPLGIDNQGIVSGTTQFESVRFRGA
jgi:hypothetical protein